MSGRSLTGAVLSGILACMYEHRQPVSVHAASRDMVAQRWLTHAPARGHERRSNVGS